MPIDYTARLSRPGCAAMKCFSTAFFVAVGLSAAAAAQNEAVDDAFRYEDGPAEYRHLLRPETSGAHPFRTFDLRPDGGYIFAEYIDSSDRLSYYYIGSDGHSVGSGNFIENIISNFVQPFVQLDGYAYIFFTTEVSAGSYSLRHAEVDVDLQLVSAGTSIGPEFENLATVDDVIRLSQSAFFIAAQTTGGLSNGYVYDLSGGVTPVYSFTGTVDDVLVGDGQHIYVRTDIGSGPIVRTYDYLGALVEDRAIGADQFVGFDGLIHSFDFSSVNDAGTRRHYADLLDENGVETDDALIGIYDTDDTLSSGFVRCDARSFITATEAETPSYQRIFASLNVDGDSVSTDGCIDPDFELPTVYFNLGYPVTVPLPVYVVNANRHGVTIRTERCGSANGEGECTSYRPTDAFFGRPSIEGQSVDLDVLANDRFTGNSRPQIISVGNATFEGEPVDPGAGAITTDGNTVRFHAADYGYPLDDGEYGVFEFDYTTDLNGVQSTARVSVSLTGRNNAPGARDDTLDFDQIEPLRDVTAELLDNDVELDANDSLTITAANSDTTSGRVERTGASVSYSPNAAFTSIAAGQTGTDTFRYTVRDSAFHTSTATATVVIHGVNDAPAAQNDNIQFSEDESPRNITFNLLVNDIDPDNGETSQLVITAVDTTGTQGHVDLTNGRVHYSPDGMFNDLDGGETATDSFGYTITDPGGLTSSATMTVTINGIDGYLLEAAVEGLGTGSVANLNLSINCGNGGSDCSGYFEQDTTVELYATPEDGSRFEGWSGACTGTDSCLVSMTGARSVTARFEIDNPPAGRVVAATLPGARSGYVGGPALTAYMTVISRQTTPAQDCRVAADGAAPFDFAYRALDGSNEPVGANNPRFDLGNGGSMGFVLVMTPTVATGPEGYLFQPQIACDNADLVPIPGVNSVQLSIGNTPVPDILSISATLSGDGVVHVPTSGNRISFMSAAAVNIGAGDGSAGPDEATVTVSVDTGGAVLPVTLEVCETNSSGSCSTPRGVASLETVFSGSAAKTFAVFVRANEGASIPFDPANSRVYLRFTDATGTVRSVTSAAISSPLD